MSFTINIYSQEAQKSDGLLEALLEITNAIAPYSGDVVIARYTKENQADDEGFKVTVYLEKYKLEFFASTLPEVVGKALEEVQRKVK